MRIRTQNGFTLIELIVVISILGILAAFAIPKFISIEANARKSVVQAVGGSVRSASALAHSLWIADGTKPGTVNMEGTSITMVNGYPNAAGIVLAASVSGDSITVATSGTTTTFTGTGATTVANCRVTYPQSTGANIAPVISVVVTDCN